MPRGPKGERRPADVIANAIHVMRIATGQIEDTTTEDGKNAGAGAHGREGAGRRDDGQAPERNCQESRENEVVSVI